MRTNCLQVGEFDLVIAMGTRLLEKWESRGFRRDILLSMALAQCGLATDTFAVKQVALSKSHVHCISAHATGRHAACDQGQLVPGIACLILMPLHVAHLTPLTHHATHVALPSCIMQLMLSQSATRGCMWAATDRLSKSKDAS